MSQISVQPLGHVSPSTSMVGAFGFSTLLPAMIVFYLLARIRRLRGQGRRADASLQVAVISVPGPVILRGQVEFARDAASALRVEIAQEGSEWRHKGSFSHQWEEKKRRVEVCPFYLLTGGGQRIRVEPNEEVRLIDAMDQTSPAPATVEGTMRVRAAQLSCGEQIFAMGELFRADDPEAVMNYRGSGRSLVLRAPRKGKMLLSSEPLGERYRAQAKSRWLWVLIVIAITACFQAFLIPYYARVFLGETVVAQVIAKNRVTTKSKKSRSYHWILRIELPSGLVFKDAVLQAGWQAKSQGPAVLVRTVPGWPGWERVGPRDSIHWTHFILSVLVFPTMLLWLVLSLRADKPWYERPLVEGGSGRLSRP